MKSTIENGVLLDGLRKVSRAIATRTTIPILHCVKIEPMGLDIRLTGTNMDYWIFADIERESAPLHNETPVCFPLKPVLRVLSKVSRKAMVEIETRAPEPSEKNEVQDIYFKTGNLLLKIDTLPAEDFPAAPKTAPVHSMEIPAADLRSLFASTAFCMSKEETRRNINGIYLHYVPVNADAPGYLRAAATDGHRLAVKSLADDGHAKDMTGQIIPKETVAAVLATLTAGEKNIILSQWPIEKDNPQPAYFEFRMANVRILTKTIDHSFPDYTRVIPKEIKIIVRINRSDLLSILEPIKAISSLGGGFALQMEIGKERTEIRYENVSERITLTDSIKSVTENFTPVKLGYNVRYLVDALKNMTGEDVTFNLVEQIPSISPVVLRGVEADTFLTPTEIGNDFQILMPMRI